MMKMSVLSVICFRVVTCNNNEVPYDIVVNKMEHLVTNKSIIDYSQLKLRKFNRTTQTWSGPYEAFIDIDNSVGISINAFKRIGNQWQSILFRVPITPYCDYAKTEQFYFDGFIQHSDLPPKESCPAIPKGKHILKDFPVGQAHFPPVFEGEYWVQQKYSYKGEIVDELSIFCLLMKFD